MSLEAARLTRLPVPAAPEEYSRASGELEQVLGSLPGIVAVYRIGSVSAPGISDLDRLAVIEATTNLPDAWSALSDSTRRLAMHSPFVIDPPTFARHRWFADLEPLELAWGEEVDIEERPCPEHVERLIAVEAITVSALKLVKQAAMGLVKVRPFLCELNNLRRDLALARVDRTEAPKAWRLADDVTRVRSAWWTLSSSERDSAVRSLLRQAPTALAEALASFGSRDSRIAAPPMRLSDSWSNVTLVPGDLEFAPVSRSSSVCGSSRRFAEARWRLRPRKVAVPPPALSLLSDAGATCGEGFRAEREGVVRHARDFVRRAGSYSAVGTASVFLQG
jgi:hypothetical protein